MLKKTALIAVILAAAGAAQAQSTSANAEPVSRAEVLADLQIFQESGLAALQGGENGPDVFNPRYQEAHAKYQQLRNSGEYAQLVQRFAAQRGEAAPAHVSANTATTTTTAAAPSGEGVTRAEVLADLEIWQASGLASLEQQRGQAGVDTNAPAYKAAYAKYLSLKASPEFEARIARIAAQRDGST